jgi:hypothetical protein
MLYSRLVATLPAVTVLAVAPNPSGCNFISFQSDAIALEIEDATMMRVSIDAASHLEDLMPRPVSWTEFADWGQTLVGGSTAHMLDI